MEMTHNVNAAECIKTINHIGGYTYRNICSGIETYVSWGSGGWLAWMFFAPFALAFLGGFAFFIFCIITGRI